MDCRLQHSSGCYYFGFRGSRKWSDSLSQNPLLQDYCSCNNHYGIGISPSCTIGTKSGLTTLLWHIYFPPHTPHQHIILSLFRSAQHLFCIANTQKLSWKLLELKWDIKTKIISQTNKTSIAFDFFYSWFISVKKFL